jgi:hypothetical protein
MSIFDRFLKFTTYCEYNKRANRWDRKLKIARFFRWIVKKETL